MWPFRSAYDSFYSVDLVFPHLVFVEWNFLSLHHLLIIAYFYLFKRIHKKGVRNVRHMNKVCHKILDEDSQTTSRVCWFVSQRLGRNYFSLPNMCKTIQFQEIILCKLPLNVITFTHK